MLFTARLWGWYVKRAWERGLPGGYIADVIKAASEPLMMSHPLVFTLYKTSLRQIVIIYGV